MTDDSLKTSETAGFRFGGPAVFLIIMISNMGYGPSRQAATTSASPTTKDRYPRELNLGDKCAQ